MYRATHYMEVYLQFQHLGAGGGKIQVYRLASLFCHTVIWGPAWITLASAGISILFFCLPRLLIHDCNIFYHPLTPWCTVGLSAAWAVMSNDRLYVHVQFMLSQSIFISPGDVSRNRAAGFHKHVNISRNVRSVFWSGFSVLSCHCSVGGGGFLVTLHPLSVSYRLLLLWQTFQRFWNVSITDAKSWS